jgi:outer membrane immunogenic protein
MKRIFAAIVLLASASAASAQEPFKWSGFYAGLHGAWAKSDIEFPGAPAHPAGPPRQTLDGAQIGGQIGYNWQVSNWVFGVETDLSWGNLSGTVRDGNAIVQTDEIDWSGSVRGRLGYAMGRFLPFLTAGWRWDQATRTQSCPDPAAIPFGHCNTANGFAPYNLSDTQIHDGFVWGGGFELATSQNWTIRLEALYADMGDQVYSLGKTPSGKTLGSGRIEHDYTTVRAAFNYKF